MILILTKSTSPLNWCILMTHRLYFLNITDSSQSWKCILTFHISPLFHCALALPPTLPPPFLFPTLSCAADALLVSRTSSPQACPQTCSHGGMKRPKRCHRDNICAGKLRSLPPHSCATADLHAGATSKWFI